MMLTDQATLIARYETVRKATERLCEGLETEDYLVQSMPDASPVKWHLAHTTWFFETFLLLPNHSNYRPFHAQFSFLFNSYYASLGPNYPRPRRGLLSRPSVGEVFKYRAYVDEQVTRYLRMAPISAHSSLWEILDLGIHHEQQHQELLLTDLKHAFSINPLKPVYRKGTNRENSVPPSRCWLSYPEKLAWIGHEGVGFAFDNETPRHRVFSHGFQIASRPVSVAEFLAFVQDGGYRRAELWLSDGWASCQANGWDCPLYWENEGGEWLAFTLGGREPLRSEDPVCHISYYEADAFARWAGARLPTESEWEISADDRPIAGHFSESGNYHPVAAPAARDGGSFIKLYGDVWQWTSSSYTGYPGYRPPSGALGEYNGKFMSNQFVLRGASCATPLSHARPTYRNFFPPDARWQFSGIRLAKELT